MNTRAEAMDRVLKECRTIEEGILEIEKRERELSLKLRGLMLNAAVMLREDESFPSYMRERISRLHALMKKMESAGYDPRKYHPLYRQLSKILDTNISDYFSPAIDAGIDRMLKVEREQKRRNRTDRTILYTLGKTGFAFYGRLQKNLGRIGFEKAKEMVERDGISFLYPDTGEGFSKEMKDGSLICVTSGTEPGRRGALFMQKIVERLPEFSGSMGQRSEQFPPSANDSIRGRIRHEGRYYYLLNF